MKSFYAGWAPTVLVQAMLVFLLLTGGAFLLAVPAQAKDFPVESFADSADSNPGDGECSAATIPGGPCTLRAAIQEANASAATPDVITLPSGTYSLTITGPGEDGAVTGDLDVVGDIVIRGSGARTTIIEGGPAWDDRIFHMLAGSVSIINRVTISGGNVADDAGAGLLLDGDDPDNDLERAKLALSECRVTHNRGTASGGGISSSGVLTITKCTIDANRTEGDSAARGGGVFVNADATLFMRNSTVSGNVAQDRGGGVDISNDAKPPSTLNNVTIADNRLLEPQDVEGAGLSVGNSVVTVTNSLIAGNKTGNGTGNDCHGGIWAVRFTLIEVKPPDCNILDADTTGNKIGGLPGIAPLADNGGQAPTHALLDASEAVDAGNPADKDPTTDPEACYADDQRGEARVDRCDMGAYEMPLSFSLFLPVLNAD